MLMERISVLDLIYFISHSEVSRGDMFVMNCSDMSKKCMLMKTDDTEYVVDLPKLIEGE